MEKRFSRMSKMERVNRILQDEDFNRYLSLNIESEKDRIFCGHNLQHFLDVARVAYIINLEENLAIEKDIIYGAALLHDIGRWKQYEDKTDHSIVGAELAPSILLRAGYKEEEIDMIISAIRHHRRGTGVEDLDRIIYEADKKSRPCTHCPARKICKRFIDGKEAFQEY